MEKISSFVKKHWFTVLVVLQILFIVIGVLRYVKPREGLSFSQDQLILARDSIEDTPGFYVDGAYEGADRRISSPVMHLDRGIYRADVSFHIENEELFGLAAI